MIRCAYCRGVLAGQREDGQPRQLPSAESLVQSGIAAPEDSLAEPEEPRKVQPLLAFVPPPAIDDWEADIELRQVERLVRILRHAHAPDEPLTIADSGLRIEEPTLPAKSQSASADPPTSPAGIAAWSCLTLGLMAFVCGGVLIAWSFVADRGDLWSLGMPLTLGGQVGLVLGLLLQLDGLSQSTRRTERTLTDLDGQLGQLREVTALVSATHSAPAHSFYAHLSDGASPQILLADLKGQLDLLARQMARQRTAA